MLPPDPISQYARETPRATAIHFNTDAWTWADLEAQARKAGTYLDREVPPGACVLLQGWNDPRFIILREAIHRTGRTYAALSPQASETEVRHVLRLTDAALFLRADGIADHGVTAETWATPFDAPGLEVAHRRQDARTLLLTSGTTGLPKACVRPVAPDLERMTSMVRTFGLRSDQIHLTATPLYHSGPTIFQRTQMALGGTTVLHPRFDAAAVWAEVAAGQAHTAFFVPTHYHRLLRDDPGVSAEGIETWWMAGAPAAAALKERVIARIGPGKLWEFLGSSETGTVTVMAPDQHLRRRDSVGRPPPGVELRILSESGTPCAPGEVGLVYVRSAMLMSGYLGPDSDQAVWNDGFLSVGDLGYVDEAGYLFLADRRTDLIISGGVNVYPAEVEAALEAFPGVRQACVVGEPDEEWGARVVAVIVADAAVRDEELSAFLREELAPAKRPRRIERWAELPHNAIGKPLRSEVRKRIRGS